MALDEEQSGAAHEMRRAIDCLRDCTDFALVDFETLEALSAGAVHFSLPAGSLLFESGSAPDGVYLVASGRLGVKTAGVARLTAEIERGELVGEAGWLLKEQRSATVVALRDSELLHIPNSVLDEIALVRSRALTSVGGGREGRRDGGPRGAVAVGHQHDLAEHVPLREPLIGLLYRAIFQRVVTHYHPPSSKI